MIRLLVCTAGLGIAVGACHRAAPEEIARELALEKKYDAAEVTLREAVEADPSNLVLQLEYGKLLVGLNRYNQAIWPLLRASTAEGSADEAAPLLARALVETSNHENAVGVMTRFLEAHPENVVVREMRAFALVASRNEEAALVDIDWLLEHKPQDETIALLELKLRALLQLQRADDAQAILTDLRSHVDTVASPDRAPRLCMVEANFTAERGDPSSARKKFESCLAEFPGDVGLTLKAVAFFDAQGEIDRATAILESACEEKSDSLQLRQSLAARWRELGREDDALELLKSARDLNRISVATLLAEHHMALDDPASALRDLEWALEAKSDRALFEMLPEAQRFMLGDILILVHQYDRARSLIEHIEEPAYGQFLEARILLEQGRFEEALAQFEAGFRIWPSAAGPRYLAGQTAEKLGDINAAIDHYRAALRSDAAASDAGLELARIYSSQGSWSAAAEVLQHHSKAHPSDARALRLLAELHARLGEMGLATRTRELLSGLPGQRDVAIADQARNVATYEGPDVALNFLRQHVPDLLDPDHRESLKVWCEIMVGLGRIEESLEKISPRSPGSPEGEDFELGLLRGQLLTRLDRYEEAAAVLEGLVARYPHDGRGLVGLAAVREKQARLDEAVALLDRAAEADPKEAFAQFEAGRLLARSSTDGRRDAEAAARLREALRRNPTLGGAALILAEIGLRKGDHGEEVLSMAERAARFAPGADSARLLGEVHLARHDEKAAVEAFRHAIEGGDDASRTHYLLAVSLAAVGELEDARSEFERSLATPDFAEADSARVELARIGGRAEGGSISR